ncbi:MAG: ABC transporter ATP-binding protein, partial [Oscillospiraceae bacterium]|nr:ABC transporter ATP-binding protein [Oscillospiraceae bacterium]
DEPLGALDLKLRKEMQRELKQLQQQIGITFVYVTHDQEEALTMSDTVVVMNGGRILQIGNPVSIYNEPINAFVADFIGESNIIDGSMPRDHVARFAGLEFECLDGGFAPDEPVDVVIRPEDIELKPETDAMRADAYPLNGVVRSIIFMGVHYEITVEDTGGIEWMIHSTDPVAPGQRVGMLLTPDDIHIMHKSDIPLASELPAEEDPE